jgi:predicted O-linked N-acetylglucosamine transferase (SPINDLY family)
MVGAPAEVAETPVSHAECGLPEDGFVFANFNARYKFDPRQFGVWMRLLKRIADAVLWLREGTPAAHANLRRDPSTSRATASPISRSIRCITPAASPRSTR